jgi:hypothetical protein
VPKLEKLPHCGRGFDYSSDRPLLRYSDGGRLLKLGFARSPAMEWNQEHFPGERGGKRTACKGFSFGSRRRMLDRLNSLKKDAPLPQFLHCTLPDDVFDDSVTSFAKTAKHWLDNFTKRLLRVCPDACGFWRIEWQSRKSGKYEGRLFPHFHLLVWGIPVRKLPDLEFWKGDEYIIVPQSQAYVPVQDNQLPLEFVKVVSSAPPKPDAKYSCEALGPLGKFKFSGSKRFVDRCSDMLLRAELLGEPSAPAQVRDHYSCMPFQDWASLAWYHVVSSGNVDHLTAGVRVEAVRSWGGVMSYCAKYMAKADADFLGDVPFGRSWGVFNRKCMPWARIVEVPLDCDVGVRLRRVARRYLERRFGRRVRAPYGITLYCDVEQFRRVWERPPPDPF